VRVALLVVAAAVALSGCMHGGGRDEDAQRALAQTTERLGAIRSGTLEFGVLVEPRDEEPFGFELEGPFELREGAPARLHVEYTRIANGRRATVTLVSTGEDAWAEVDGERVDLDPEQRQELLGTAEELSAGGLEQFQVGDWIASAELERGDSTDVVRGDLDVVAAVNGLARLAGGLGRDVPQVEGESAQRLREATESATYELETGTDDRLLRRLLLRAVFAAEVPEELRDALGDVVGATITFHLGVSRPNEPVTIESG